MTFPNSRRLCNVYVANLGKMGVFLETWFLELKPSGMCVYVFEGIVQPEIKIHSCWSKLYGLHIIKVNDGVNVKGIVDLKMKMNMLLYHHMYFKLKKNPSLYT